MERNSDRHGPWIVLNDRLDDHYHSYCESVIPSDAVELDFDDSELASWRPGEDASGTFVVHAQYRYTAPVATYALDELSEVARECGDYKVELISKAPRNSWAAMRSCGEFDVLPATPQVTTFGFCEDTLDPGAGSDVLLNMYLATGSWVSYVQVGAPSRDEADALVAQLLPQLSAEFVAALSA